MISGLDEPQHPSPVHEHPIQLVRLLTGGGGGAARLLELELEVGDPQLELGHLSQPMLGVA